MAENASIDTGIHADGSRLGLSIFTCSNSHSAEMVSNLNEGDQVGVDGKSDSHAESMDDSVAKDGKIRRWWKRRKEKIDTVLNTRYGSIVWVAIRLLFFFCFLYVFMCALSIMSDAFRLIAGIQLGKVFRENPYLTNPIVDLMIGVLVTMLIHSSGTTTAIMISMAASKVVMVRNAIYVNFGAEIGTSITSTLVSIIHIGDRTEFRRAFAAATIQSVYNWLSVLIIFPLEVGTHFLEYLSNVTVEAIRPQTNSTSKEPELLQAIIKPVTSKIIQLNTTIISHIADGKMNESEFTTMIIPASKAQGSFLFMNTSLSDGGVGGILLTGALICILCSLAGISKTMTSILQNQLSKVIKRYINTDLPGRFKFLTGYIFILVGAILTAIIQSSTIFTSTLTPMVGVGLINVDRVFPLVLGANVGTTFDSVLAALAQDPDSVRAALTVAMVVVYFNILGIIIFYPIPFMRYLVMDTGKWLGKQTCQYRWFAFVYIIFLFVVLPITCVGLSIAGKNVLLGVLIPLAMLAVFIGIVNALQTQKPNWLPPMLRTWDFLPEPLHSLQPYDHYMKKLSCAKSKCCSRFKKTRMNKVVPSQSESKPVQTISVKSHSTDV